MASDHKGGEMSGTEQNGTGTDAPAVTDGTDELRARMKLRLAQNKANAERDKAARPAPAPPGNASVNVSAGLAGGGRQRPASGGVSQMVWNSVLDSLSAPGATTDATPAATTTGISTGTATGTSTIAPPVVAPVIAPAAPAVVEPVAAPLVAAVAEPVAVPVVETSPDAAAGAPPDPAAAAAVADAEEQQAIAELFKEPAPANDFGPIVPAMPVLAPPSRATPPPRAAAALADDETLGAVPVAASKKQAKQAAKAAKAGKHSPVTARPLPGSMMALQQRKKRHPIRAFLTFVLVVALLGGAGFAGWYKFLRHRAVWSNELRPTATFVEQTVHRSFDKTVPVTVLSVPEYEVKLGLAALDRLAGTAASTPETDTAAAATQTAPGPDMSLLAIRAVGLVGANPMPTEVGHLVAASVPAFYSTTDHTIYRLAGDSSVFQVSLVRAMTMALLDQDLDIGSVMSKLTDSQRAGFQAMLDGVVARVVDAKFRADPSTKDSYGFELQTRRTDAGIVDGVLPVYLSPVVTSIDVGVPGATGAPADDPVRGLAPPPSDAPVFDATREPTAAPTAIPGDGGGTDPRVLGVQFWFDALTPALGAGDARNAALLWTGDRSVTTLLDGRACLSSTIATVTADDAAALAGFLGRWVQTRPASSNASATAGTDPEKPTVAVSVCEPTEGVVPPTAALDDLASLYLQPDVERALLQRVADLGLPASPAATACAVAAYRNGSIPGFSADAASPDIVTALTNVVTFCRSAG